MNHSGKFALSLINSEQLHAAWSSGSIADSLPWMPKNGALHGLALDRLMKLNLAAVAVLFVLAHLLLAAALLKHRKNSRRARFSMAEALPLGLLCGLYLWMAVTAERLWAVERYEGPSPEAMQVEVVGVQFQWYFRYPGQDATFGGVQPQLVHPEAGNPLGIDPLQPDGQDDVVSSELILPAGREVDLRLRAHDVIHGFFIPGMRLKQNAVPGLTLHVHFTPMETGRYSILCTQVCGLGHSRMQAQLHVVSAEEFSRWLAARRPNRTAMQDGDL